MSYPELQKYIEIHRSFTGKDPHGHKKLIDLLVHYGTIPILVHEYYV